MSDREEIERIERGPGIPAVTLTPWKFDVDLGEQPDLTIRRILEIVRKIADYDFDTWPSDQYWQENLPTWLKKSMPERSDEEWDDFLEKWREGSIESTPWHFESWLSSLKERAWYWWGYELIGDKARLVVEVTELPPRITAFRKIIEAAGATITSESHQFSG